MPLNSILYSAENFFSTNESGLVSLAIFLIIFVLVFGSIKKVLLKKPDEAFPALIIALAISMLATFYMPKSQITMILQSYNIMGFIIAFILPLIILISFIHGITITSKFRRGILIAFGVLFFYLSNKNNFLEDIPSLVSIGIILLAVILDEPINKSLKKN